MKEKRKEIKLKNGVGKEIKLVATLYIPGCRIDLDTSSTRNLPFLNRTRIRIFMLRCVTEPSA